MPLSDIPLSEAFSSGSSCVPLAFRFNNTCGGSAYPSSNGGNGGGGEKREPIPPPKPKRPVPNLAANYKDSNSSALNASGVYRPSPFSPKKPPSEEQIRKWSRMTHRLAEEEETGYPVFWVKSSPTTALYDSLNCSSLRETSRGMLRLLKELAKEGHHIITAGYSNKDRTKNDIQICSMTGSGDHDQLSVTQKELREEYAVEGTLRRHNSCLTSANARNLITCPPIESTSHPKGTKKGKLKVTCIIYGTPSDLKHIAQHAARCASNPKCNGDGISHFAIIPAADMLKAAKESVRAREQFTFKIPLPGGRTTIFDKVYRGTIRPVHPVNETAL